MHLIPESPALYREKKSLVPAQENYVLPLTESSVLPIDDPAFLVRMMKTEDKSPFDLWRFVFVIIL